MRWLPLTALLLLSTLLLHLAPLYYKSYLYDNLTTGSALGQSIHVIPRGTPIVRMPSSTASGYMLLNSGDRVSFDATVSSTGAIVTWSMELEVIDIASGERWDFKGTYYTAKGLTPEFIAPYTSLYRYMVRVKIESLDFHSNSTTILQSVVVSGSNSPRDSVRSNIVVESLLVILALILTVLASRSRVGEVLAYSGIIGQVRWELRSMYLWLFFPLTLLVYTLLIVNFNSSIGSSYNVLLDPIRLSGAPDFYIFYTIVIVVAVAMLFVYRFETGYDRPVEVLPRSRLSLFTAKILAVILVTLVPLIIASLNTYILWQGRLLRMKTVDVLEMWFYEILFLTALTLLVMIIPLLLSNIIPYTGAVLALSLIVLLAIYVDNPVKSILGLDMRMLIISSEDPIVSFRAGSQDVVELSRSYAWFTLSSLALGSLGLVLSLLLYLRREYG